MRKRFQLLTCLHIIPLHKNEIILVKIWSRRSIENFSLILTLFSLFSQSLSLTLKSFLFLSLFFSLFESSTKGEKRNNTIDWIRNHHIEWWLTNLQNHDGYKTQTEERVKFKNEFRKYDASNSSRSPSRAGTEKTPKR